MKTCPKCGGSGQVQDNAEVGASLRKERKAAGRTLRGVGAAIGLSPGYLCDLEHGRRTWSPDLIRKYREALA